jgi:capsular exopolysaccharide synthesis family protein
MAENIIIRNTEEESSSPLDFKRVLGRLLRYWYIIAFSIIIALGAAFILNRYADRLYPAKISILIKESEEVGGNAELLYNNPLVDPYRNFYNEVYIIKSIPIIQKVVEDLNLMISFKLEGQVKTSEVYKPFPFEVHLISDPQMISNRSYMYEIQDDHSFLIKQGDNITFKGSFNDTLDLDGLKLYFKKEPEVNLKKFYNEEYFLNITNSRTLANNYINKIEVEWAEEGSSVLYITLVGEVPEKNTDFLHRLAQVYAEVDFEKKVKTASQSINFIVSQLREIEDSLSIYEAKLESFKARNYTTQLDQRSLALLGQLEELEKKIGEYNITKNYFDYLKDYLAGKGEDLQQVVPPTMIGINDPIINDLLIKYLGLQNQIKRLPDQVEKNNMLVARAYEQINELERQIIESIDNIEATQKITVESINRNISRIENQLTELPSTERRYVTIKRNYSFNERLYDFLIQKRAEAEISKASSTSDIIVVNPAVSGGPIYPNITYNYIIASVVGLGIPFILFILFELFNNRVQSREDIEKFTDIPFIGSVGHAVIGSNLLVYKKPKSAMAEAYRAVRSNLNYFTEGKDKKTFLVTSSISGEGKTFTTINLATVFAYSGKKTIIVGADMRRPRIFDDFELTNDKGLSSYLSGQKSIYDCIQETKIPNLDLLSAGPVPPNPSELLLKKKFSDIFEILFKKYDYVLIDSPPITLVTDALVVSKYADHIVYIVRQNVTPRDAIGYIDEIRRTNKIRNISILFNDIKRTGLGYGYGKGYGYYYGYAYGNDHGYYEDVDE